MSRISLFSWLKSQHALARIHEARRRSRPGFAPRLESLETRALLNGGYVFATHDNPGAPAAVTSPNGIGIQGTFAVNTNDRGQIVGNFGDANSQTHSYLETGSHFSDFDDPLAGTTSNPYSVVTGTVAFGVNNFDQIVGTYVPNAPNNVEHSFLLSGGKFLTIDPPGAANLAGASYTNNLDEAGNINDLGQIVGGYTDTNGVTHGYLLSHGHYTVLDDPQAAGYTNATGINDLGQIVGSYFDSSGVQHGFLLSHGKYTTLDDPNSTGGTQAFQINNFGQIVGSFGGTATSFGSAATAGEHGFVLSGGVYTTLDDPNGVTNGQSSTYAEGINDFGEVVGFYFDSNGLVHGFSAMPASGVNLPFATPDSPAAHGPDVVPSLLVEAAAINGATPPGALAVDAAFGTGDELF